MNRLKSGRRRSTALKVISEPLSIIKKTIPKKIKAFLKAASGFGGSNTAAVFREVSTT